MNVEISKSGLKRIGSNIAEEASNINQYIKNLDNTIDKINTAWQGNDSLIYINTLREKYLTNLSELKSLLNEYGVYLTKIPGVYETLDESFRNRKIEV